MGGCKSINLFFNQQNDGPKNDIDGAKKTDRNVKERKREYNRRDMDGHGKQNDDKNLSIAYQMTSSPYIRKISTGVPKESTNFTLSLLRLAFRLVMGVWHGDGDGGGTICQHINFDDMKNKTVCGNI